MEVSGHSLSPDAEWPPATLFDASLLRPSSRLGRLTFWPPFSHKA
jgi:hypothetical protein